MLIRDIFNDRIFSTATMLKSMSVMPKVPTYLESLGIYSTETSTTPTVGIEYSGGMLGIVKTYARGSGDGDVVVGPKRRMKYFNIPHLPQLFTLTTDDIGNIAAFDKAAQKVTLQTLQAERMEQVQANYAATREYHQMGALKGLILDSDGTPIYNLFTEFGVIQEEFDFDPLADEGDPEGLRAVLPLIQRYLVKQAGNTPVGQLVLLMGNTVFDQFVNSPAVLEATRRQNGSAFHRESPFYTEYSIYGVRIVNYQGYIGDNSFIGDEETIVIPQGVRGLFRTVKGPTDTLPQTLADIHISKHMQKFETGIEFRAQRNELNLVTRPSMLVKLNSVPSSS